MSQKAILYKGQAYISPGSLFVPTKLSQLQNDVGYITTDNKVEQEGGFVDNDDFEILFSGEAGDNDYTGLVRKNSCLKFNPYGGNLTLSDLSHRVSIIGGGTSNISVLQASDGLSATTNRQWINISPTDIVINGSDDVAAASRTWDGTNTSLKLALKGKVNKAGDTMSGDLQIQKSNSEITFSTKSLSYGIDTTATNSMNAVRWIGEIDFKGKNDNTNIGYAGIRMSNSGDVNFVIGANNKKTNGSLVSNVFEIRALKDGSLTYFISNQENFRTALGLGTMATQSSSNYVAKAGDTMSGDLLFSNSGTNFRQIKWTVGSNDYGRIGSGATEANAGYMEIATADDGNEPIYVRQYTGNYTTVARTLTLLNASGNSVFPGQITGKNPASSWIQARDNACFRNSNFANNGSYYPVISTKSSTGTWSIGVLSGENNLRLQWESDTDYNNNNNTSTGIVIPARAGTIFLGNATRLCLKTLPDTSYVVACTLSDAYTNYQIIEIIVNQVYGTNNNRYSVYHFSKSFLQSIQGNNNLWASCNVFYNTNNYFCYNIQITNTTTFTIKEKSRAGGNGTTEVIINGLR